MRKEIEAIKENILNRIREKGNQTFENSNVFITIDGENEEVIGIVGESAIFDNMWGDEIPFPLAELPIEDLLAIYEEMYGTED